MTSDVSVAYRPGGIVLASCINVNTKMKILPVIVVVGLVTIFSGSFRVHASLSQIPQPPALSEHEKHLVKEFEKRVKAYVKMREQLEGKMPKLSNEAKPEEIEAHKKQFQERVRAARASAKPGEMFTPEAAALIRKMIKDEYKGRERVELRDTVLREAENKAVPLRVNYPYPESQELLEMPPTLLLRLPQLPKQIRYRFVGNNLLLVDRENGLIIDFMAKALP